MHLQKLLCEMNRQRKKKKINNDYKEGIQFAGE